MSRGVLFIGGRGPDPRFITRILEDGDLICAADSGLDAVLAAGLRPDGVVGDMDSVSDISLLEEYPAGIVERYPEDKDDTDTDLGLAWLRRRGCRNTVLIGGGEGRLDHSLAILGLFSRPGAPGRWYTAVEEIRKASAPMDLDGRPGNSLSVVPVGPGPWAVRAEGLYWPLDGVEWAAGGTSLSNRFVSGTVRLDVLSGRFLCIRPLEEALAN